MTNREVGYAGAQELARLSRFLIAITDASNETGWHVPQMVASCGDAGEEEIVVGVRWIGTAYVAEIR